MRWWHWQSAGGLNLNNCWPNKIEQLFYWSCGRFTTERIMTFVQWDRIVPDADGYIRSWTEICHRNYLIGSRNSWMDALWKIKLLARVRGSNEQLEFNKRLIASHCHESSLRSRWSPPVKIDMTRRPILLHRRRLFVTGCTIYGPKQFETEIIGT